ncbi:MAG: bifunctional enoyl-CoA hydratase/phosphate acetyltransferase [Deltaproteobacteria bacterium]|nr:bifunctional enoyl-CoA hydratase/phosphate acetyltransferase [Deltaproteobacteria bacterium]
MNFDSFKSLTDAAKAASDKARLAVVNAQDEHTLESIIEATANGLIAPILIGDEAKIKELLTKFKASPSDYRIVHQATAEESLRKAIGLIHAGEATAIMKGALDTGMLMKAIVSKENKLNKGRKISLIGFFEIPRYPKMLALTDMGINTYPDLDGKRDILLNAVETMNSLGFAEPKVALLAATEILNPKMPETVHADQLKKEWQAGSIKGCVIEGPISLDLATSEASAKIKGYRSPVAGSADLLMVPDIVSGNVLAKAITGLAGGSTAGLVIGAAVPVVLTSRSAEASDKYHSIALAAVAGQAR